VHLPQTFLLGVLEKGLTRAWDGEFKEKPCSFSEHGLFFVTLHNQKQTETV
jgi:hypothetical protein